MPARRHHLPVLGVLLVLAVVACTGGDDGRLLGEGEVWRLVDGGVDGEPVLVVPDARVTLQRTPEGAGGTSACNQYFAALTDRGGRVTFEGIGATEMGCPGPPMDVEQRYLTGLDRVTGGTRQGDRLVLTGPGVELSFTLEAPVEAAPLVGTLWLLDGLVDGEAISSVSSDVTDAELILEHGGVLRGSTGCRRLEGRWEVDGDVLVVPDLSAVGSCPPEGRRQDEHVFDVLFDRSRLSIDGRRLSLRAPGGLGLEYRVQDAEDG